MPIIFVVALALQSGSPNDVAFGRYVRQSGLAVPLVLLLFGSVWLFPLITALVAGDIIASESHNGTLKTILTRSLDRGEVFAGKPLAASPTRAGPGHWAGWRWSRAPSSRASTRSPACPASRCRRAGPGAGGRPASPSTWCRSLAVACIGLLLSALTRNSAAAVVGTLMFALLMQLIGILPGLAGRNPTC